MTRIPIMALVTTTLLAHGQVAGAGAGAGDEEVQWVTPSRARLEIALGTHLWPGVGELEGPGGGSFDEAGFDINFAAHWPVMRFPESELLLGVDLGGFTGESNIQYLVEDLATRGGYLVPSVKWMFAGRHRYSLDAGLGLYTVDIAEIVSEFPYYFETEIWQRTGTGGFVGATVDFGGGRPHRGDGVMLAVKVHFFDLGSVRDDDTSLPPVLGADAGDLGGPVYSLLVGYRWR